MADILRQLKQTLLTSVLALFVVTATSQTVSHTSLAVKNKKAKQVNISKQLKSFIQLASEANVEYIYPPEFKEIPAINNDYFSFDYALELPGHDFEVWFRVRSQKKIVANYPRMDSDTAKTAENPDSLYNKTGLTLASALGGGQSYFTTIVPPDYLARYHATAGKTYLLDLADTPETKHYKYALLITLHKDRVGTIVAVCFGNEKGAEFFKNIFKASKCLKFKS